MLRPPPSTPTGIQHLALELLEQIVLYVSALCDLHKIQKKTLIQRLTLRYLALARYRTYSRAIDGKIPHAKLPSVLYVSLVNNSNMQSTQFSSRELHLTSTSAHCGM